MINNIKLLKTPSLITDEKQRQYFLGFKSSFGYLLITDTVDFYTDSRYLYAAKAELESQGVNVKEFKGLSLIKDYLKEKGIKTLGIDYTLTTLSEQKSYKELGVKFKDISSKLEKIFAIKNKEELKNIVSACNVAQKALYNVLPSIKKGVTEKEIKDKLEYEMKQLGAEKESFDSIVAFGKNSAVPHHQSGDTVLEDNMAVLIDFGCVVNGYCSDCTRTFYYGEPSEKFINAYNAVLEANIKAEEQITKGMRFDVCDKQARDVLDKYGLSKYFTHSLGHGIGVNVHEYPYLSPRKNDGELKSGMVFSIEPGVYFDGEFGIRIEDTCYLQGKKVKRLFNDEKNLIILK